MKNTTKRKTLTLMSIGMLVISTSQIFSQFMELTDLMKGSLMGLGIGLLLTSMVFGNFKKI
ncbi:hypothetical protein [Algibacter lectus]|uniref:Uncharacterized protein n=1 Tax=Algibacter lectus TaxID=221126 RepID=A0A4V3HGE7_9FLAO|nr:hypothetical protein [Algibacter lectus]MDO7138225.1 hypothetical protein [Algibacter lectus]TDY61111.1 hypothetical protein DFQ06_3127 [Algibacter lectus]